MILDPSDRLLVVRSASQLHAIRVVDNHPARDQRWLRSPHGGASERIVSLAVGWQAFARAQRAAGHAGIEPATAPAPRIGATVTRSVFDDEIVVFEVFTFVTNNRHTSSCAYTAPAHAIPDPADVPIEQSTPGGIVLTALPPHLASFEHDCETRDLSGRRRPEDFR